jgi:alpha-N-arabinofuranosidase
VLDAVATHDAESGGVVVLAVNRSLTEDVALDIDLRGFPGLRVAEALTLSNPDHTWSATADDATSVLPRHNETAKVADDRAHVDLPPVSWSMLRLDRV